ncbi:oligosaccharide flippase family protein [Rubrolithibacter danxiaensis]|uniref:oligosaccharide flippase family protein n=1 Tax=Rubrolithibacter danxiaensis TaxID=3390805 RepID=UPI003BF778D7
MRDLVKRFYTKLKRETFFSNFLNLSTIQLSNALLLIIIYPVLTRIVGLEVFGLTMVANTFAGLVGIIVNYGTNQSGIIDITSNKTNKPELSKAFFNVLAVRLALFAAFLIIFIAAGFLEISNYSFYILSIPLIIAEVINPLFFFVGIEKLFTYNLYNLLSKIISLITIILFVKGPPEAPWINFYIGTISICAYLSLIILNITRSTLFITLPRKSEFVALLKNNSFLLINNVSVHLQQSVMVFVMAKWGQPTWLGAYTLCDKIIWSSRIFIISISNAIYPKAIQIYNHSVEEWELYREKMKKYLGLIFFLGSVILSFSASFCVWLIVGESNNTAVSFLRVMAFAPTVAALNSLNVLDLLLKNNNKTISNIALALLTLAVVSAVALVKGPVNLIGAYSVIVEFGALMMYQYFIKKSAFK